MTSALFGMENTFFFFLILVTSKIENLAEK